MKNEKKNIQIIFVILHYQVIEQTQKCVDSILKNIDTKDYQIIIVDNASPNKTGEMLIQLYKKEEKITVLLNSQNLGFARGNNIGIKYAREYFNTEFIVVLNNDVYLIQGDLYEKLLREFSLSNFSVLGPMIMTGDGRCNINPVYDHIPPRRQIENYLRQNRLQLFFIKIRLFSLYHNMNKLINRLLRKKNPWIPEHYKGDYFEHRKNIQLHGCFLVFSNKYFEIFKGFDESTFLYMEENILYMHLMKNNLISVYTPDIVVYHEEDAATDASEKSSVSKLKFQTECNIQSIKEYLRIYDFYYELNE